MMKDFYHLTPLTSLISFMFFDRIIIPSNRITKTIILIRVYRYDAECRNSIAGLLEPIYSKLFNTSQKSNRKHHSRR